MKATVLLRCWISAVALGLCNQPASGDETLFGESTTPRSLSAQTLVVFNSKDPESGQLARFYASKRQIAEDHVVGLDCATQEEISRQQYDQDIAEPLRTLFNQRQWWHLRAADDPLGRVQSCEIRFVVLLRGMPLRIAQTANYEGDLRTGPPAVSASNGASVDSELAGLGLFSKVISGTLNNPYYRSFLPINDALLPGLLLVCRLDAPTPEVVRRMIRDSLQAERQGLGGFTYVDGRGIREGPLAEGDRWLSNVATAARRAGSPVIFDNSEALFAAAYPMRSVGLYFGWYSDQATGPMTQPGFRFEPGAIAVHIHSFSALSLREPARQWCAPLLCAGAAATMGNVAEPYLALTPNLDVFHDRLRAGLTFAESAWMSERVLSWMTTFIGDPLYRPFRAAAEIFDPRPADPWQAYAKGAKLWSRDPTQAAALLNQSAAQYKSGAILEGLGLLQTEAHQTGPALESFERARRLYTEPADIVRTALHEIALMRANNNVAGALELARTLARQFPKEPASALLREAISQMAPANKDED